MNYMTNLVISSFMKTSYIKKIDNEKSCIIHSMMTRSQIINYMIITNLVINSMMIKSH